MVKELAEQVLYLYPSLSQGFVSKYHHLRNSLVMVKTSNQRLSMDGITQSNSTYDCTTYPRMLQEQETTGFSIQKDGPKKRHSKRQTYLEKAS